MTLGEHWVDWVLLAWAAGAIVLAAWVLLRRPRRPPAVRKVGDEATIMGVPMVLTRVTRGFNQPTTAEFQDLSAVMADQRLMTYFPPTVEPREQPDG